MGWDDTPADPVQDSRNTNPMSDLTMPNLLNNSSRYNYNSSMTFNPIPQPQVSKVNTPTYQARPLSGGGSIYMESIAVPTPSSTLKTAVVQTSNSTFAQRQNASHTMDDNARFRERLKGIMADDNVKITPVQVKKNDAMPEPKPIPKDMPSKKQLRAIAKERKKQYKKNLKIMESMEKYDKDNQYSKAEKYGRDDR
jgi:hypothetical protein